MSTWDLNGAEHHLLICNGDTCLEHGGNEVTAAIRKAIKDCDADHLIHTTRTRCNGRCEDACVVIAYPEGTWFRAVTPSVGEQIVTEHLLSRRPLAKHVIFTYGPKGFRAARSAVKGVTKRRR